MQLLHKKITNCALHENMSRSRRELTSFHWNGTQWAPVASSISSTKQMTNETVRLATLNILADCFPWFIEMAIRSNERFEWLCRAIVDLNPTILGLNEVTTNALEQLQQCSFIRENYFITESVNENNSSVNGLLSPHGCVILSRMPFEEVFAVSVSGSAREAVIGKVQLNNHSNTCVYVCSHHTTAYQTPKNAQLRSQQIRDIVDILQPLNIPYVIMGDLNLHYQFEDAIVTDNNFVDGWAQTHFSSIEPFNDGNEGFTFDAIKNTLIPYYIPGECRQMRLDRILFSSEFPAFSVKPCVLWANQSIKSDNYLFPSDHFGLSIDLIATNSIDNTQRAMYMGKSDPSVHEVLSRNAENNENRSAYSLGLVRRTVALVSHFGWLAAISLGLKK